ncbi:hypothetical protein [Polynucleobacter sp. MG-6-Vaara-E2]|uniref:beta strand repeat-containing protein n=1 Tax=Polynucleobacter sp. MG-6-Vaara-E2 TaxID=2576932 RepID=UPI001BFD1785|nr:hypothetical protein [Polynucleobacter sp. MG-6-Vaara-E2]QWD96001.1 hypothetical protein ICV38_06965 [Polynucleobacter sp. MG-6-Vaara-E2]
MTIAIKIGAGAQVYDNVALANAMRGTQKLSITGTGDEIRAELTSGRITDAIAANIGSIKATNDLNLTATQVTTYKAALVKLGTKSIVLDSTTAHTDIEAGSGTSSNFNNLDAVYSKIKSLTITPDGGGITQPTIAVAKLDGVVNLAGLEKLSGNVFNVSGSGADIQNHMDALLKNISSVGSISITGATELKLTASQLAILGDKLVKGAGSSVTLKDNADNILTTASLALISKLNNSNINTATQISTTTITAADGGVGTGIITPTGGFSINTGDALTYSGIGVASAGGKGALTSGQTVYARKLDSTNFALYDTFAHAIDLSSTAGLVNTSAAQAGTLVSQAGNAPTSSSTLDKIDVTKATLAQAARLGELGAVSTTVISPGVNRNRLMPDLVRSIQIADTASNLNDVTNDVIKAGTTTTALTDDATTGKIHTSTAHGFKTGDAITYNVNIGGTAYAGLTTGTTYFVGKLDANNFVLYDTKAKALAAHLNSQASAYADTNSYIQVGVTATASINTASNASTHSFSASSLDKAMSAIGRLNNGAGNVTRVTLLGDGTESSTTLGSIAAKVLRANANADVTYSAKAVNIQNNLQALYDNVHSTDPTVKKLTEIVVSDGTANSKKGFSVTEAVYTALKTVFANGVDNLATANGLSTPQNKNYSFNVSGVAFNAATPDTYQQDVNVSGYSITGASYSTMDPVNTPLNIVKVLGQSKMKSITTAALSASQKADILSVVNSIGSPVDRAKMKIITA